MLPNISVNRTQIPLRGLCAGYLGRYALSFPSVMMNIAELACRFRRRLPSLTWILCDMDGTLVNTDNANYLAYKHAVLEVTGDRATIAPMPARRITRRTLRQYTSPISDEEYISIIQHKESHFEEYLHTTILNRTVLSLLRESADSTRTAIVTNCGSVRTRSVLRHHDMDAVFDAVISRDHDCVVAEHNKYKRAINELGASPASTLAFENDRNECRAAIAAGLRPTNILLLY